MCVSAYAYKCGCVHRCVCVCVCGQVCLGHADLPHLLSSLGKTREEISELQLLFIPQRKRSRGGGGRTRDSMREGGYINSSFSCSAFYIPLSFFLSPHPHPTSHTISLSFSFHNSFFLSSLLLSLSLSHWQLLFLFPPTAVIQSPAKYLQLCVCVLLNKIWSLL